MDTTTNRPVEGWHGPDRWGQMAYVMHDCTIFDRAPEREGWKAFFIGRHGIGPGSWTRWTYKPVAAKEA